MSTKDQAWAKQIDDGLTQFLTSHSLPGLTSTAHRDTLVRQFVDSIHRVEYVKTVGTRQISNRRLDPSTGMYDPIRAAAKQYQLGNFDEACWQSFLSVHFGKNLRSGWRLAGDVYGALALRAHWDWATTSSNPAAFRAWLGAHQAALKARGGRFGNHRKYVSLDANSSAGTGAAVATYVGWVTKRGNHAGLIQNAANVTGSDPRKMFDYLYRSMGEVASFGRMGKFDYLTMLAKLKLAQIEPGSAYLVGATGPLQGAKLLLGHQHSTKALDGFLVKLGSELGVDMQVVEDAVCNWQKSPRKFIAFRG